MKAKVLPLPVRAAPSISRPHSAGAMARACMSVSVVKWHALRPALVDSERGKSEKLLYRTWGSYGF